MLRNFPRVISRAEKIYQEPLCKGDDNNEVGREDLDYKACTEMQSWHLTPDRDKIGKGEQRNINRLAWGFGLDVVLFFCQRDGNLKMVSGLEGELPVVCERSEF